MILQGGGGGVVSICKHAQNHDGRIIVDAFLHPKNRFFFHSNKKLHFGHVPIFCHCTVCFKLHSVQNILEPYQFYGVVSTSIGWPFAEILQRSGFANFRISGWTPYGRG